MRQYVHKPVSDSNIWVYFVYWDCKLLFKSIHIRPKTFLFCLSGMACQKIVIPVTEVVAKLLVKVRKKSRDVFIDIDCITFIFH